MKNNFSIYIERRKKLIEKIKHKYPNKTGIIVLFAGFESEKYKFRQDSSVYYFTGLEEPAMVLLLNLDGSSMIYLAQYTEPRNKWASSLLYGASKETISSWGITDIQYLGNSCKGYSINQSCTPTEYEFFNGVLSKHIKDGDAIFTIYADNFIEQRLLIERLMLQVNGLKDSIIDISDIIASMRREKSKYEIEQIYKAVECTMLAQAAAASSIEEDMKEYEIQAGIEYMFCQSGGKPSFPSIVASGANSTVLHYTGNTGTLKKGDLVVVDIGAELNYYCADLTRTYPVSGIFSKRQKEVYKIVLDTQNYIADIAKPGYWLRNKDYPEKSLHHLAVEFLKKAGYAKYFTHGLGHYLGLDVHDVGSYSEPLKEGDVFTIEPGIYIPEEKLGIRIEDNYWVVKDGIECLSADLPKEPHEVEDMMAQEFDEEEQ